MTLQIIKINELHCCRYEEMVILKHFP